MNAVLPVPDTGTVDINSDGIKPGFGYGLFEIGGRDARNLMLAGLAAIDQGDGIDLFNGYPLLG